MLVVSIAVPQITHFPQIQEHLCTYYILYFTDHSEQLITLTLSITPGVSSIFYLVPETEKYFSCY